MRRVVAVPTRRPKRRYSRERACHANGLSRRFGEAGLSNQPAVSFSHYQILATPQVILNRPPSKAEVTTLGLGDLTVNTIEQPQLTLVILKGARFSPVVRSPRPHRVAARSVFPARTRSPVP